MIYRAQSSENTKIEEHGLLYKHLREPKNLEELRCKNKDSALTCPTGPWFIFPGEKKGD